MVLLGSVRSFALQSAKARIPMIKFRKGAAVSADHNTSGSKSQSQGNSMNMSSAYSTEAIEDWQLPLKWRRRNIDLDEVDYINRGGPA
ncbi:uncharacterized protein LOC113370323 [Ctenocephalides felis]|uniref:uncharacterized protein LOC113370323 n=1 Tax=Ctenocephalides felis TaxID=7515 RepID=UPI000E6E36FB|nr:uncharacterized protein LOC113370323 [Ctenocephalides felis]